MLICLKTFFKKCLDTDNRDDFLTFLKNKIKNATIRFIL